MALHQKQQHYCPIQDQRQLFSLYKYICDSLSVFPNALFGILNSASSRTVLDERLFLCVPTRQILYQKRAAPPLPHPCYFCGLEHHELPDKICMKEEEKHHVTVRQAHSNRVTDISSPNREENCQNFKLADAVKLIEMYGFLCKVLRGSPAFLLENVRIDDSKGLS